MGVKLVRNIGCVLSFCCGLIVYSSMADAASDERRINFDIPDQEAGSALNAYALQAEVQLLFPYDRVQQFYTNEVKGEYTAETALVLLLENTGLEAMLSENGNLSIIINEESQGNTHDMNKKTGFLSTISALLFSSTALVDSSTAQEPERNTATLEEIMVTARRVEENLQETPISVTAFSGDALARRQIVSTEALDQVTPNLQFTNNTTLAGNNASSVIFIRGIGQTDPTSSVDPGVGLYIDDVYMGQSVGGTMDFRDIASVQVLRGPQGTLFGRNTIGGAILLTTNDPGEELGGSVRVGLGSDSLQEVFAAVDVPFSNDFRSRYTFGSRTQDGYVTRIQTGEDLGDTDTFTGTAKFLWTPSDALSMKASFDYTKNTENGNPFVFAASNEDATFQKVASRDAGCPGAGFPQPAVPLINDDRCANDFQNKGPFRNNGTHPLKSNLVSSGMALNISYDVNDLLTFKSISSYRSLEWQGIRDADNTPLTILHTDYDSDGDQFSQELQLLYNADSMNGVFGFYYHEEEIKDIVRVQLNIPPPGIEEDSDNNTTQNDNWALFTQWNYDLTDQLGITLGGRYTEDTKGSIPDQFNYADPSIKYLPVRLYEEKFTATTFSGSLNYFWNDDVMTYGSYSEGFKGGGWNSHFNRPQTPAEQAAFQGFDPEEVATWELGFKMDLAENRLRLNGALFTSDYDDLQFTYRVGVAPYLANAGKASIDGFELEATLLPDDNWIIETGVGYLNTRIDELNAISGTAIGVQVGNDLPFSPQWQANLGVGYTAFLPSGFSIVPRVDLSYNGTTFFDANNTIEIAQEDSASVVNLSVEFMPPSEQWRVVAGVNNASDELYPTGGNSSLTTGSGYAEIAYARPRQYFLNFTYNFNQ
ncbi:TonB-dependent receptor [Gammaproteobacteria bacterium]|nr:TonB-dependent receptor [Gammaproteobacteria bacterium]